MEEIFVDIKGFEGLYQISNFGTVKSLPKKIKNGNGWQNRPEKIIKQYLTNKGYIRVMLQNNYVAKNSSVHRLIATHFIPNPQNKPQVNHINGIKTDNRISNLEWNTSSENQLHSIKIGNRKIKYGRIPNTRRLSTEQVKSIRLEYSKGNTTQRKLAAEYGIHHSIIHTVISGRLYKSV